MAISSVAFLLIPIVSALAISFDSPKEVYVDEEFSVNINLDTSDTYDVKIFVHNSEDDKIEKSEYLSEIYGDGWQDSWYYLKETFPDEKEYKVSVTDYADDASICVRVRKTDTQTTSIECKGIKILEEEKPVSKPKESSTKDEPQTPNVPNVENISSQIQQQEILQPSVQEEKIVLKSNKPQVQTITTKTQTSRQWIVYSFVFLCVTIIILLALRKL